MFMYMKREDRDNQICACVTQSISLVGNIPFFFELPRYDQAPTFFKSVSFSHAMLYEFLVEAIKLALVRLRSLFNWYIFYTLYFIRLKLFQFSVCVEY